MDAWTGFGTFSLSITGLAHFSRPSFAEFGWALVIGGCRPVAGIAIRRLALVLRPHVEQRVLLALPAAGLLIGGLAVGYAGMAMGIGAMSAVMLTLPLSSVLLATLLLLSAGLAVMPLVIVAVVVAYVLSARLSPGGS